VSRLSDATGELRLDEARSVFAPGEEVAGSVSWQLPAAPERVALRLFWRTDGRGTEDLEVALEEVFEAPGERDRRSFLFRLPAGPYSFSGKLISLSWGLELVAEPFGALAQQTGERGLIFATEHGVAVECDGGR